MTPQEFIAEKRDGHAHSETAIREFIQNVTRHEWADYQVSAWLMATVLQGLTDDETIALTTAMAESGERLNLDRLPRPWVDKHSTGGVGDKTTLVVLPLMAACGLTAVKMSGRGLGITGGTIDKLESVPGFRVDLSPDEMINQAERIGIALTGQTPRLAPADKALYALRDATATVKSLPLIASSILSKKIAGGCDTVILDVKCGQGAFMQTQEEAMQLAALLKRVAEGAGLKTRIAVTDMNQPLGYAVGNSLEVIEAIQTLTSNHSSRFAVLCKRLVGMALWATGLTQSLDEGHAIARHALVSGTATQKAKQWFEAQGVLHVDELFAKPQDHLNTAKFASEIRAGSAGWVSSIAAATVAEVVMMLGGGRLQKEDRIDPTVGVVLAVQVGDEVRAGDLLATIYSNDANADPSICRRIQGCISVSPETISAPPLFLHIL